MKIRDPKTGDVMTLVQAVGKCCKQNRCSDCPMTTKVKIESNESCIDWAHANPAESARLMGYEIIEEEPMEETKKPRICEVLGVEPDEEWEYQGCEGKYRIHNGIRQNSYRGSGWYDCENEFRMMLMVEHPERIIRKPRWTEAEVMLAKGFVAVYPDGEIERRGGGELAFRGLPGLWRYLPPGLFPSAPADRAVRLSDIIGGEA